MLDTVLIEYDLKVNMGNTIENVLPKKLPFVAEVQTADSWNDYRPARPIDFVGRDTTQKDILNFLESAKEDLGTRVFAITGDSGLGKSSLIAKLRDKSKNRFYRKKYFVYAVDMRGAREPTYILASLIQFLREAQKCDFGDKNELFLTNPDSPLSSNSVQLYLESLVRKEQVVCLIFDQFEEIYAKPELFGIFNAAKNLMLDVASIKSNIVLGFAWKTDNISQDDHPAYYAWHELSDYRKEFPLDVFEKGEILNSITKFEKEIRQNVDQEIKHQIIQVSQGFPWLLKRLYINLYDGMVKGKGADAVLINIDVERLFYDDLKDLSQQSSACLKLIAQKAPADWSEIIEISGITALNNLIQKHLVIKSGDRLNVYWDIFRDYLLTKKIPTVPYNYIPKTEASSLISICIMLKVDNFTSSFDIGRLVGLKKRTVLNIGADLVILGLAERKGESFKISDKLGVNDEIAILKSLREKMGKHSLKTALYQEYSGKIINQSIIRKTLKKCVPRAKHEEKTWSTYSNRLAIYLIYSGFLSPVSTDFIVQDAGSAIKDWKDLIKRGNKRSKVFLALVSPSAALKAFNDISDSGCLKTAIKRNELSVLKRLDLVTDKNNLVTLNLDVIKKSGGRKEAIWEAVKTEMSVLRCIELMKEFPNIDAKGIAEKISFENNLNWKIKSKARYGVALRQWSLWIKEGIELSNIPEPRERSNKIGRV